MVAKIIDGLAIARMIRQECRDRVRAFASEFGFAPGLAVVLVGDNPASLLYVRNKIKACEEVGIRSSKFLFPASVAPDVVIEQIRKLNEDDTVHGILVQLPLPISFDVVRVLGAISVGKDVDGFHLYNLGGLVVGNTVFPPCTPYGVVKLLEYEGIPLEGKNVVVVGASRNVGKPMALMLMQKDATVSVCHAKTRDLAQFTILADILVVAAGHPMLISSEMVRDGAVVIDVGINRTRDGKLTGDVDFRAVCQKASFITPVPGGVGPMTVTMLLVNTVTSAERAVRSLDRVPVTASAERRPSWQAKRSGLSNVRSDAPGALSVL
jgi:methylenetetrahydrofolate dehydrogenase (NADP+) / methenyltetrahydrofolate cyclohydrolase